MAKVKNISGEDRIVPELGGLLVFAGQVIEVPDERAEGYVCQQATWAPGDETAEDALAAHLAPPQVEDSTDDEPEQGEGSDD